MKSRGQAGFLALPPSPLSARRPPSPGSSAADWPRRAGRSRLDALPAGELWGGAAGGGVEPYVGSVLAPVAVGVGGGVGGRHLAMEAAGVGPPEAPYPLMGGIIARAGLPGSDRPGLPDHNPWVCEKSPWQRITLCSGLSCRYYEERR